MNLTEEQIHQALDNDPETQRLYSVYLDTMLGQPPVLTTTEARAVQPTHETTLNLLWQGVLDAAAAYHR